MNDQPTGPTALDRQCAALLEEVRARCPHLLPKDPLPAGMPGQPVPIESKAVNDALAIAVRQAAAVDATGRLPAAGEVLPNVVVWEDGESALAIELAKITTEVMDGQVIVTIPVRCDQLPDSRGTVRVVLTVGLKERPAGLLAATPRRPEGPDVVVRRWDDALTALAWRAFLDIAGGVAKAAGADTDGTPLIAAAVTAAPGVLEILPQARHSFDRVPTGRVVRPS